MACYDGKKGCDHWPPAHIAIASFPPAPTNR